MTTTTETMTMEAPVNSKRRRVAAAATDEDTEDDIGPETDSTETMIQSAMDVVEGVVLRSAGMITEQLKASYDKEVYSDVLYAECCRGADELGIGLRVERNVLIPIIGLGRMVGTLKLPFAFYTKSGRSLLLLEVKTKKSPVKEADMENLGCAVEQIALANGDSRPRAMLINFSSGVHATMVMQCDGTISN
jgi:hypothetical protein